MQTELDKNNPGSDGRTGAQEQASPGRAPGLDEREQKEVEERSSASAQIVYGAIQKEGEEELQRSTSALGWSGLAAGLSMGFSFVVEALIYSALPDAPWRPLVSKLGYSVGFLIVVLGRQQLFTENTLTPVLPLLKRRTRSVLLNVLRLWGIVLAANLLGALIFAAVIGYTQVFQPDVNTALTEIGREALKNDFWSSILRGVFAGWLIALMVWLLPSAETARVSVIIIITYVVGLAGFTHIIAGSTETFYMALTGQASWVATLANYTLPTLIGNTLGGVSLVAALNHAQVVSGSQEEHPTG